MSNYRTQPQSKLKARRQARQQKREASAAQLQNAFRQIERERNQKTWVR